MQPKGQRVYGGVSRCSQEICLAAGTFQHHLVHGSLSYTDAANGHEVISQWSMCSEALSVLHSAAYQAYFDNSTPQEDRSVITFRKIANHVPGCPARPAAPPPPLAGRRQWRRRQWWYNRHLDGAPFWRRHD